MSLTSDNTTQTRSHNQQNQLTELTQVATTPLGYDASGNLTQDEAGRTLVYDAWQRLLQVKDSQGQQLASYAYDTLGQRIEETHRPR